MKLSKQEKLWSIEDKKITTIKRFKFELFREQIVKSLSLMGFGKTIYNSPSLMFSRAHKDLGLSLSVGLGLEPKSILDKTKYEELYLKFTERK